MKDKLLSDIISHINKCQRKGNVSATYTIKPEYLEKIPELLQFLKNMGYVVYHNKMESRSRSQYPYYRSQYPYDEQYWPKRKETVVKVIKVDYLTIKFNNINSNTQIQTNYENTFPIVVIIALILLYSLPIFWSFF